MTESWCGSSTHISQSNWLMPVWLKIFAIASDVKNGIRWLPPRFDRPSGRPIWPKWNAGSPSATRLFWKGTIDARVGKGALGRGLVDSSLRIGPGGRRQ